MNSAEFREDEIISPHQNPHLPLKYYSQNIINSQVAGSVGVSLLSQGRVTCKLLMGRTDVNQPDIVDSLPDPCHNATSLKKRSVVITSDITSPY